ncbi:MAG: efflux RND transporter permease subunit [Blastocatellia bacterium]
MSWARVISNQSRAVVVFVALLCAAGAYAAFRLPIAIFPQTDFPRIVIIVDNGVVPAAQMLVSVTRPIEEAMNGIPGIQRIRSTTQRGSTGIDLFFDWNVDIIQSLQLVQARLSQLASSLPPTAAIRRVDRLTFAVFPVAGYSITSDERDPQSLRELAAYTIRPRLARLPGIAQVAVAGGETREYHIAVDPERLHARGVSLQQVADAVRNANVIDSPGLLEENHQLDYQQRIVGRAYVADVEVHLVGYDSQLCKLQCSRNFSVRIDWIGAVPAEFVEPLVLLRHVLGRAG